MNDSRIKVSDDTVIIALSNLSHKQMKAAYKEALRKSVTPIYNNTKRNLRKSGIKNINKPYVGRYGRVFPSMLQGIRISVFVGDVLESWAKVHIMKNFLLKFFEKGTVLRKTKKRYNRGAISAKWFFRSAVQGYSAESERILDDEISKAIVKKFEKTR